MKTTTYYDLNIVEGTDIVNPLTVDNPNYQKIDETMHDNAVAGVTLATELTNATIHALTRENSDCSVIRFIATSKWKAGDSVTVDGVPVLALLPSGETLPDGAYVINANVLCVLTGTNLTVYVGKSATDANEIAFNDTTVGAELVRVNGEIVNLNTEVVRLDGEVDNLTSNLGQRGNYNFLTNWVACPKGQTTLINLSEDISSYPFLLLMLSNAGSDTAINSHETVLIPTKMFISGAIQPVLNWYTNSGGVINFMVNVMYNNNNSVNAYASISEGGTAYVKVCGVK